MSGTSSKVTDAIDRRMAVGVAIYGRDCWYQLLPLKAKGEAVAKSMDPARWAGMSATVDRVCAALDKEAEHKRLRQLGL